MPFYLRSQTAPEEWADPIPVLDPYPIEAGDSAPDDWFEKANTIELVSGCAPSVAYLVLPRFRITGLKKGEESPFFPGEKLAKDLDGIDFSRDDHRIDLVNPARGDLIITRGWSFMEAHSIDSGSNPLSSQTAMLCEFQDTRSVLRQSLLNQAFNMIRGLYTPARGQTNTGNLAVFQTDQNNGQFVTFYSDTIYQFIDNSQGGSTRFPWTWANLLEYIWTQKLPDIAGEFPSGEFNFPGSLDLGEPSPPAGQIPIDLPFNYRYFGTSAWEAFCELCEDIRHKVVPGYTIDDDVLAGDGSPAFQLTGRPSVVRVDKLNRLVLGTSPQTKERDLYINAAIQQGRMLSANYPTHNVLSLPEKIVVVFSDRRGDWQRSNLPNDPYPFHANQLSDVHGYPIEEFERNEHRPLKQYEMLTQNLVTSLLPADKNDPNFLFDPSLVSYTEGATEIIQVPSYFAVSPVPVHPLSSDDTMFTSRLSGTAEAYAKQWLIAHFRKLQQDYVFSGFPPMNLTAEIDSVVFDDKEMVTVVECIWPPPFILASSSSPRVPRVHPYHRQIYCQVPPGTAIIPKDTGLLSATLWSYGTDELGQVIAMTEWEARGLTEPPANIEVLNLTNKTISGGVWLAEFVWELDRWCILSEPGGGGTGTGQDELPPIGGLDVDYNYNLQVINRQLFWVPLKKTLVRGTCTADTLKGANSFTIDNIVKLASCGPLSLTGPEPQTLTVNNIYGIAHKQGQIVVAAFREAGDEWDEITNATNGVIRAVITVDCSASSLDILTGQISSGHGVARLYTDGDFQQGIQSVPIAGSLTWFENWMFDVMDKYSPILLMFKSNGILECIACGCKTFPFTDQTPN